MRVPQVNESAHLYSMGNLISPTDRPTNRPRTGVRVGWMIQPTLARPRWSAQGTRVGWMEKRTEVQRR